MTKEELDKWVKTNCPAKKIYAMVDLGPWNILSTEITACQLKELLFGYNYAGGSDQLKAYVDEEGDLIVGEYEQ